MSKDIHFCISCYEGNLEVLKYAHSYSLLAKYGSTVEFGDFPYIEIPNVGYNLFAYFTYILENYSNLPDNVLFIKNNIFPRHMSEDVFCNIINSDQKMFFDPNILQFRRPFAYISPDNRFFEFNNDWYLRAKSPIYFGSLNKFLSHFFVVNSWPVYVEFPPGGNLLVSREQIMCRPIEFYARMSETFDYCELAPESYFVERSLFYIFNPSVEINPNFACEFPLSAPFRNFRHIRNTIGLKLLVE